MSQDLNLFEVLDLDPNVSKPGVAALRARLQEKIEIWSRDRSQGSPKQQRRAQLFFDSLQELERAIEDPKIRDRHAEQESRRRRDKAKALLLELDEQIDLLRASGRCERAQLDQLLKRFEEIGEQKIKKRLRDAGVPIEAPRRRKEKDDDSPPLERKVMSELRERLEVLGKSDLYAFLDLGPQSSIGALCEKAARVLEKNRTEDRRGPRATAENELAGKCRSRIFVDEATKLRYDSSLALEAMEELRGTIELAGSDRLLTRDELDHLVEMARRRGVASGIAIEHVLAFAEKRGWVVQTEDELPAETLQRCGFCLALNSPDTRRCQECGQSLELDCPRCGTTLPTSARACQACGCRTGDAPLVQQLLAEGRLRLAEGHLVSAAREIERALVHWPDWPPAIKALEEIEQRKKTRQSELEAVTTLLSERRLVAAERRLRQGIEALGREAAREFERRIKGGLAKVERTFASSERLCQVGRADEGLEGFERCLELCVDYEPARRVLKRHPPASPETLSVSPLQRGFRLRWKAPEGKVTGYRVVRKSGGLPRDSEDGELVGKVRVTDLDDLEGPIGEPTHYSVFSERTGVLSVLAATSGPHRKLAEIDGLEAIPGDSEVILAWSLPPGSEEVEVERWPDADPARRARFRVSGERFVERRLSNGETLCFSVRAVFRAVHGMQEQFSKGRKVSVTPQAPPPPVLDLEIRRRNRRIEARWTPGDNASVELWRWEGSTGPDPRDFEGRVLAPSQLEVLGLRISVSTNGLAQDSLPGLGTYVYMPVTISEGLAVVGRGCSVTSVDPVRRLRCRRSGNALALSWDWPTGVERALICWSHEGPVDSTENHEGSRARIERHHYERDGCWRLSRPRSEGHHFAVFAESSNGAFSEASQIYARIGREATIHYRLLVKRSGWRRRIDEVYLELETDGKNGPLPRLKVVSKRGNVPISPADGHNVLEVSELAFEEGKARIAIPEPAWQPRSYFKIFWKDPSAGAGVRLLPAARDQLRI